jgi:DNA-binding MurR/RpiR family transcriptional regulator
MLERPHEAAFLSAAELGARASVSDSTVVRLPAALGYAGYPELRQELQSILSARIAPVDLLRQRRGEASDVAHSVAVEIDNLQTVVSSISPETIERACAMVIRAKRVFVMGLRGAFGVAHQFAYLTQQELGTITLLSSLAATSIDQLSNLNSRDLFVAFSAARYARETVRTAEYAAKAGVPVIAITDNALSPLSRAAVVTIAVPFRSTSFFPSYVAALAVVQLIAARISRLREERVASRLTRIDELADEFEVLLERGDDGA